MEACQEDNIFVFYSREIYFETVLTDFKVCSNAQACFPSSTVTEESGVVPLGQSKTLTE